MTANPSPDPASKLRDITTLAKQLKMPVEALKQAIDKGEAPATWADDSRVKVLVPKFGPLYSWARKSGLSSLSNTCAAAPHPLGNGVGPLCQEHLRCLPPPGEFQGTALETIRLYQRRCAPGEWGTGTFVDAGIDPFTVRTLAEGMVAAGESVKGSKAWSFKASPAVLATLPPLPDPWNPKPPSSPKGPISGTPESPPPPPAPEAPPPAPTARPNAAHALLGVVLDEVEAAVRRIRQRVAR